jgi:acyl-CoA synthetase (AMP-forming)/AMP-acid ligase II
VLLGDYLDYWARERPRAEFAVSGSRALTYAQAATGAGRLAGRLQRGRRVAVLAKNALWYPVLYFAASKAGAVVLPLNWRLTPGEWLGILADAEPTVLIAGTEFADTIDDLRGELPFVEHWVVDGERRGWEPLERWLSSGSVHAVDVHEGDALYQMYTSGTTGTPKGAVLSHGAVTANIVQIGLALPVFPGDRGLAVVPMFHAAILPSVLAVVCRGGTVVMLDAFDPEAVVSVLERERIAVTTLVPAMLLACLGAASGRRFEQLRAIYYGASPIAEATLRRAMEAFGCGFVQSYGMTEAAQALTFLSAADHEVALDSRPELLLSAGRAAVGTRLAIADREIVARGPQLMTGYWRRPEETAQTLRDGWLHTGDAGRIDEQGYLFVDDRMKDMIVSGGENVYPRAVEEALSAHPAVAEAAVIGVPDERWGETVKAVVVLEPGRACTQEELIDFCGPRMAGFERPRSVDFVDALPRTATGKVLKRVLREPYWTGRGRRVSGA